MNEEENDEAPQPTPQDLEKIEEAKLKAKYPLGIQAEHGNRLPSGRSLLLRKRLTSGQKYFDSGDYQMARQRDTNLPLRVSATTFPTGDAIPTPDTVPIRKASIIQPKFATSNNN